MTFLSKSFDKFRTSVRYILYGDPADYAKLMGDQDMARIVEIEGKANLYNDGELVASYARRRDAVRGAKRRGLSIA